MFSMLTTAFWKPPPPHALLWANPGSAPPVFHVADRRRRSDHSKMEPFRARRRLTDGVATLLERDIDYRRRLREVLARQRVLRRRVDGIGWRAYLSLEEAEFDRWVHALDRVAHWAHARGRRARGRR